MALSAQQIAKYAYDAGFRGEALTIAVAVALAESGGNPGARNPKGEDSRGLWQINVAPDVRANKWGDLYDPAVNAKAAFEVSGGGENFQPWTTYSGATAHGRAASYTKHMPAAKAATESMGGVMGNLASNAPQPAGGASPATGSEQATLPPNATPQQIEEYVREHYPQAVYLLSLPEIRPILLEAGQGGWSEEKLRGAIEGTDWFKNTSDSLRQWEELRATDPATAAQRRSQQSAMVSDQAARLGVTLNPAQLTYIVELSIGQGWTQQQITDNLLTHIDFKKPVGDARTTLQDLRSMAADYAVPVDKKTLEFWTKKILAGEQDADDFKGFLVGQAIGLFEGNERAIGQLEAGFNVRQIAAGSLGYAGRELDIADTSTLDLMDPKWLRLVHHYDPETKTFRPMSGAEVVRTVRRDRAYGYNDTPKAKEEAAGLGTGMLELMGYR